MIETAPPEVNVEELMRRIREEVARRKALPSNLHTPVPSVYPSATIGGIAASISLPRLPVTPALLEAKKRYVLADFLNFHDEDFIRTVYRYVLGREPDAHAMEHYLNGLRTGAFSKVEVLGRIRYSPEGRARKVRIRGLILPFASRMVGRLPIFGYFWRWAKFFVRLPVIARNVEQFEAHVAYQDQLLRRQTNDIVGRLEAALGEALQGKVDAETVTALGEALQGKADTATVTALGEALQGKADTATVATLSEIVQGKADVEAKVVASVKALDSGLVDLKRNLLDQQRRVLLLLEEARKRLPELISREQIENMVAEEDHLLDAFYVSFEDHFRGTRADIRQRVSVYLPIIRETNAGREGSPILDIGCGRGEWLELLKESELTARGLDLNRVMVDECRELDLDVVEAEAIEYLRGLKPNSLGAVTGMHIIEHIPFKRLVTLFDETLRVLQPGGVAIFETPNPENLIVGACNFYYDPTHQRPLPPEPMRYVAEGRGFSRVEILRLHPYPETAHLHEGDVQVQQVINSLFFSAQDYALVAYKV